MKFIRRFCWILKRKVHLAKMNNPPIHHCAGSPEARGPMQLHRLHRLKAGPAHHRFVATYFSILLRDNGHYFRKLFETHLLQQPVASFVGQSPAQWFSNFYELWAPTYINWRVRKYTATLGLCNITAKVPSENHCSRPQWTAPWTPNGAEGPVWETLVEPLTVAAGLFILFAAVI